MARKNLLQDLIQASDAKPADPPRPRAAKGAIGTVSRSIADLKSRSVLDLDPELILEGGLKDRLAEDGEAHAALLASIRDYGQQVPVLVRPAPDQPGMYQIVYGRRRVAALRDLGQPVRALVRDLDDADLVLAQGQENAARRDLTFIEKVNFARQMQDAGYDRKAICAALHIDKTLISRMLTIADRVPVELIEAIGPAPAIGRDRWAALAKRLEGRAGAVRKAVDLAQAAAKDGSNAAFEAVLRGLDAVSGGKAPKTTVRASEAALRGAGGVSLGSYSKTADGLSLRLSGAPEFEAWLLENLERLHKDWLAKRKS